MSDETLMSWPSLEYCKLFIATQHWQFVFTAFIIWVIFRVANVNSSVSASPLHMAALRIGSFICTHSICDDLGQTSFHSPLPHRYSGSEGRSPLTSCLDSPACWCPSVWCLSHNNSGPEKPRPSLSALCSSWNLDYVNSGNTLSRSRP